MTAARDKSAKSRSPRLREVSFLFPIAILLLVLTSTVAVLAYRQAIEQLTAFPTGTLAWNAEIAHQRKLAARLFWTVLGLNSVLAVFLLVYLQQLLLPYRTLLERARSIATPDDTEDELDFLLATYRQAVEHWTSEAPRTEDLAVLEQTLGESVESGVLLLDDRARVVALNEVGGELLGAERPKSLIPVDEALAHHPQFVEVLTRAVESSQGLQRQEVTGENDRTIGLSVHALRRDDGTARGFLVLFVDLTDVQRESEQRQAEANFAQLGVLTAGLAHELRNSLGTLKGYLTLIDRQPERESFEDYLSEIRLESDHLQRVLDDFLSFARPESRQMGPVDLAILARRTARDPSLEGMPVEVTAPDRCEIVADEQLLERAVRNLLHNAARAEREAGRNGPLAIVVAGQPGGVELAVEDRGRGMPAGDALVEPFASGRADGVGLGLALVDRIATVHAGHLAFSSRAGGGTRAILTLPTSSVPSGKNE